jgi:hypothetical protein
MPDSLPILVENSIQIAWDYLEGSGELGEPELAGRFLLDAIESMVRRGERRQLMLSNKAIDSYREFLDSQSRPVCRVKAHQAK